MKTLSKFALFSLIVFAVVMASCSKKDAASSAATAPRIYRWACTGAPENHTVATIFEAAKEIKEQLGIDIQVFPSGQLGGDADILDMCRAGAVDMVQLGPQMIVQFKDDLQGLLMPFTFDDDRMAERFYTEYLKPEVLNSKEFMDKTNLYTIQIKNTGPRQLTTKGIPVRKPSDLNGVKIRSMDSPISAATIRSLGGSPVPVPYSELYMAMQTGVVQGQDNGVAAIVSQKYYEVQDYFMPTQHSSNLIMEFMNRQVWESFTPEQQQKLTAIFEKYEKITNETTRASEADLIKQMQEHGMKVVSDLDTAAFRANADKVMADAFGDPKYDSWRAMRKLALDWCEKNK
jgi:tripartite ATP-independent transporter DctP family solute receptor